MEINFNCSELSIVCCDFHFCLFSGGNFPSHGMSETPMDDDLDYHMVSRPEQWVYTLFLSIYSKILIEI